MFAQNFHKHCNRGHLEMLWEESQLQILILGWAFKLFVCLFL